MPPTAVEERRARVADLIGDRPLSARSVLATALLGADQPHLKVGELVEMAALFGISDGAARTCLWRMASAGELTSDDGTYALAGRLLDGAARRRRIADRRHRPSPWDGTWELAVVSLERRPAGDRLALRRPPRRCTSANCAKACGCGPTISTGTACRRCGRADQQCVHFHGAETDIPPETVRSLFKLDDWAADARRLTGAMRDELDVEALGADDFAYQFALSITAVRHLQLDPLLPAELIPRQWPAHDAAQHLSPLRRSVQAAAEQLVPLRVTPPTRRAAVA